MDYNEQEQNLRAKLEKHYPDLLSEYDHSYAGLCENVYFLGIYFWLYRYHPDVFEELEPEEHKRWLLSTSL